MTDALTPPFASSDEIEEAKARIEKGVTTLVDAQWVFSLVPRLIAEIESSRADKAERKAA